MSEAKRRKTIPKEAILAVLDNGSRICNPFELQERSENAEAFSFPEELIVSLTTKRNPCLSDAMRIRKLLVKSVQDGICIHCRKNAMEGDDLCSMCKREVFYSIQLPYPYKYCAFCKDYHYFMYFVSGGFKECHSCINSDVDVKIKQKITIDVAVNNLEAIALAATQISPRFRTGSPSLFFQLQRISVITTSAAKTVCLHCRRKYERGGGINLCERCRSDYIFTTKSKSGQQLQYKWCRKCSRYHSLEYFYHPEWACLDLECLGPQQLQRLEASHRSVELEELEELEEPGLERMAHFYPRLPCYPTLAIAREAQRIGKQPLAGKCLVCLSRIREKKELRVREARNSTDRSLDIEIDHFFNGESDDVACEACKRRFFLFPKLELPVRYCVVCNLFHYYFFFFNREKQCYEDWCQSAILFDIVQSGCSNYIHVTPCKASVVQRNMACADSPGFLNRSQAPQIYLPPCSCPYQCIHCRCVLPQEFKENTEKGLHVCSFCKNTWFRSQEKYYRFCRDCCVFHYAQFYYDPLTERLEERCLSSQLNQERLQRLWRKRQASQSIEEDQMDLPPEVSKLKELDLQDMVRLFYSQLHEANPKERVLLSIYLACILLEYWS